MQSRHPLSRLFEPASVAVVGARENERTVGGAVARKLLAGYQGDVFLVNPRHRTIAGRPAFSRLRDIGRAPDLVVLATPPRTLPELVEDSARCGAGAVAVLSSMVEAPSGPAGTDTLGAVARRAGIRLLGPNSLGLLRPSLGLDASFSLPGATRGSVALLTQSGGLASALLDWAAEDGVGFSSVVSLGNQADVSFAEALDYLTADPETDSIVLYLEGVRDARRFVSALRAAARIKPVVVLKGGRGPAGTRAAETHTGAMSGPDDAFDAALRRCGAVRVKGFVQLFSAAKYLSSRYRPVGRQLAVVTNGGGPGVVAVDCATASGLHLATLSAPTLKAIDAQSQGRWTRDNPVDLMEDADPVRFLHALGAALADPGVDGAVAIVTPQVMTDPPAIAQGLVELSRRSTKPLLACFMGERNVREPIAALLAARIPAFRVPEAAVEAFANIADFYANQRLLMQVPGPDAHPEAPADVPAGRAIVERALAAGRMILSDAETLAVLGAFRIPVAPMVVVADDLEAVAAAHRLGTPVALKVDSPDVIHKSGVGGVHLGLNDAAQVRSAYAAIRKDVRAAVPHARIGGIAVQPMIRKPHGREWMVGVFRDPVFGPVITLGAGGKDVELIADRAVALPPLNGVLAANLVDATRAAATLGPWRAWPAADRAALERILLRVSEMVCELPWIDALDINPLVLDEDGAVIADARMTLAPLAPGRGADRYAHMAIRPYPANLVRHWPLPNGRTVTVRPIRPEDAAMEQAFVRGLSEESRYFRFANALNELSERMLVRFTQIDYDRELALVAVLEDGEPPEQIGVARYAIGADESACEFALVVADAWQGRGIGRRLMEALMDAATDRGLKTIVGYVLAHNTKMLGLMDRLGFSARTDPEDPAMKLVARRLPAGNPALKS